MTLYNKGFQLVRRGQCRKFNMHVDSRYTYLSKDQYYFVRVEDEIMGNH